MKLEHIHHSDLRDRAAKQLGPLIDARADEQTAVRTALNRNARGRRVALGDQVLGRRLKVCARVCKRTKQRWMGEGGKK